MHLIRTASVVALACAVSTLTGCLAPAQVKDVLNHRSTYIADNFGLDSVSSSIRRKVTDRDTGPLGFSRIDISATLQYTGNEALKPFSLQQKRAIVALGGPFVQETSEFTRNGIPTTQWYDVSYRGILSLRSQRVHVGATLSNMIIDIKSLPRFEAVRPSTGSRFSQTYEAGTSVQLVNFKQYRYECVWAATYPASRLNASIQGDAQDVECTAFNANDAMAGKSRMAYLKKYGVAILTHMDSAAESMDATFDSVSIH